MSASAMRQKVYFRGERSDVFRRCYTSGAKNLINRTLLQIIEGMIILEALNEFTVLDLPANTGDLNDVSVMNITIRENDYPNLFAEIRDATHGNKSSLLEGFLFIAMTMWLDKEKRKQCENIIGRVKARRYKHEEHILPAAPRPDDEIEAERYIHGVDTNATHQPKLDSNVSPTKTSSVLEDIEDTSIFDDYDFGDIDDNEALDVLNSLN